MSLKSKLVRKTIKHYALAELKRHKYGLVFTAAGVGAALLTRSAIRRSREYDPQRITRFTELDQSPAEAGR